MVVEINIFSVIVGAILWELVSSYIERKSQERKDKKVKKVDEKPNKPTKDSTTEES